MSQLLSQQAALSVMAQQQALAGALGGGALGAPGAAAQTNQANLLIAAQLAQLQAAQLSQLGWPLQGATALNPAADLTSLYANQLGLNMGLAQLAGLQVSILFIFN